jgi:hypothetical protein
MGPRTGKPDLTKEEPEVKPLDRTQAGESVLSPPFLLLSGVAVAALVLSVFPLLREPISPVDPRLASRIDALEARASDRKVDEAPSGEGTDSRRLEAEVRSLRASLQRMQETLETQSKALLDLTARIGRLEEPSRPDDFPPEIGKSDPTPGALARLEARVVRLERGLAEQIDLFDNHTHTLEARDLQKGWSHASPGWANDLHERRADSAERRLTTPLPISDVLAVWSDDGYGRAELAPEDKVSTTDKIEEGKVQQGKTKRK